MFKKRKDDDMLMDVPSHRSWRELCTYEADKDHWWARVRSMRQPRLHVEVSEIMEGGCNPFTINTWRESCQWYVVGCSVHEDWRDSAHPHQQCKQRTNVLWMTLTLTLCWCTVVWVCDETDFLVNPRSRRNSKPDFRKYSKTKTICRIFLVFSWWQNTRSTS